MLTDRQTIARLLTIAHDQPHHAARCYRLIGKVRAMGNGTISSHDAMSLGCTVKHWSRRGGFHPERGSACMVLHYLNSPLFDSPKPARFGYRRAGA